MKHYICTGTCNGVSSNPGTCQAKTCNLHGDSLVECGCEDGTHQKVKNQKNKPSSK